MGKLIRVVVYVLGGVVLLLVAAAIILPLVVNPDQFKDEIAAAVQSHTGRTLDIEGDIDLSVFPWLGLDIGHTSLSNAKGFSDRPFVSVDEVQIRVKLLPLLSRKLVMDTVELHGLKLSLETDPKGRTNWQDLGAGAKEEQAAPAEEQQAASQKTPSAAGLAALTIGGVEISDADVLWDDRKSGSRYQIEGLSLKTGAIRPGKAVPFELKMALESKQPQISGPLSFAGVVLLSEDSRFIQVSKAVLRTELSGEGLPGGELQSQLGFNATLNLGTEQLELSQIALEALGLKVEGYVNGSALFGDARFDGELRLPEFVPREVIQALGQPLPEVSDPAVLGKADASLKFKATLDSANLTALQARLDDSHLKGTLAVKHFARPAVRFDLALDGIDVDRYLPPPSDEPVAATPTAAAAAGAQMIPVETLRALDVDGKLTIGKLKVMKLHSSDILVKVVAKDGVLRLQPVQAKLYQGQYQGDIRIDARGKQPKIALNDRLEGVQVGPLLKDMTGQDRLSGKTRASARLSMSGQTPDDFKKTLDGKLSFAFTDGAVKGINLAAMIRKAQAKLNGQPAPAESGPNQTDFSSLTGTATVRRGVIHNTDLLAQSPLLRVHGEGDIDLPQEKLDYLVTAKIVGSLEGQGGKSMTDLRGIEIPVEIAGTFAKPEYKVRLDQALREKAEKKIKKKIEQKLEKNFGDQLKGLFR
ncbi:MAG TPA: AsmA family protein [Gammaproteobacteria bacterium]|nr:AsmA family protein [Gammaproteobacteria bacterium]